jgi:polar amino acid transport system substrate-binding protein
MLKFFRFTAPWVLLLSGCLAAPAATAPEMAPLKVGVSPAFPPLIYKEAGKFAGLEADFARVLGAELGRPVTFVELKWEDQVSALVDGRTDIIMSGMSVTRTRQLRVAFATPYLSIGQATLVRREELPRFALGYPATPKGTIGVLESTTGDFLVQQEFPRNKRRTFKSPLQAARALEKKQIDLLICDSPIVLWLASMNEIQGLVTVPVLLSEESLAWAVRKSDPELLSAVNGALERLQKDGQATSILRRWIPVQP